MSVHQKAFREALHATPLIAILRGKSPSDTVAIAESLWEQGVSLVEIPLHSQTSLEAFAAAHSAKAQHPGALLGVGSVRSLDDYLIARDQGADFTVSPGLFDEVCSASATESTAHLPGVFTPSEVGRALDLGFTTVKLFPAATYGPSGLQALRDPFPDVDMVAVGGVNPANAADYLRHGAIAVGMGSALTRETHTLSETLSALTQNH